MLKRALLCTAAVILAAGVGMAAPKKAASKTIARTGWITDNMCGAKMAGPGHEACLKECIGKGAKYVLYDTYNKKTYQLDPQSAVAAHGDHHVRVYGTLDGDTIHVTSVKMLMAAKKAPKAKAAPKAKS